MLLKAPLFVHTTKSETKKGKFILNLNNYRNAFPFKLNTSKIVYKNAMKDQIDLLPPLSAVEVSYTYYPGSKTLSDKSNILSIHEKYFMDALVEFGKLPDDNYLYDYTSHYHMGYIDKENPRVEIFIKEVEPKKLKDFIL